MKKFDFKKYTEYKVYSVTTIKKGYGFRVLLKFADGTEKTKQHSGFSSERAANAERDEVVGQLHGGTYIVYDRIKVADFMEFWLEEIMRPRIADNSYNGYKNVVYNYVNPQLGKMYMATLNQENSYEYSTGLCKIEECNSGKSSGGRFTAQKDKEESIS